MLIIWRKGKADLEWIEFKSILDETPNLDWACEREGEIAPFSDLDASIELDIGKFHFK